MYAHNRIPTGLFIPRSQWQSTFDEDPQYYALDIVGQEMVDDQDLMVALLDVCSPDQIREALRLIDAEPTTLLAEQAEGGQ